MKLESKLQSVGTSAESARLKAAYDQKVCSCYDVLEQWDLCALYNVKHV